MDSDKILNRISMHWREVYAKQDDKLLSDFIDKLHVYRNEIDFCEHEPEWYKDAIVYSLYVDLFNKDFSGLQNKLEYISDLGVSCLWLLPVLESPMKDAGFDISDYRKIRPSLFGDPGNDSQINHEKFKAFLKDAHQKGLKVIFDIAINHISDEHIWFKEAVKSKDNQYKDYFIWNNDTELYKDARIIFKGLCDSNWEKFGDEYYFHRFFEFQPDLNYRNPAVLIEMAENMIFWLKAGVDGFRADAIPYLWKEEGTDCENLPQTHSIVKFFRAVLDYVRPGTLLLAEACQKPREVVKYFGDGDECNAGYHFPLMPQIFKSIAIGNKTPVSETLSLKVTPEIPESAQWFTFLRCHDELSLELVYVTEEDRKLIHEHYCRKPEWNFREGQGISARLAELMDHKQEKIKLIFSVMLTLPGTPVIYYGDEFGKSNDMDYYRQMIKMTGKDDTRFLVRGTINWEKLDKDLSDSDSFSYQIYSGIRNMIKTRKSLPQFGRGDIKWMSYTGENGIELSEILSYERNYENKTIAVLCNLSDSEISLAGIPWLNDLSDRDLLGQQLIFNKEKTNLIIPAFAYHWIRIN